MLLILVLCAICSVALSSNTVLPESHDDRTPTDGDEYRVRNHVSDHELPKDVPTKIGTVGDLGTPPPGVDVDFVPRQTYVQVRRYDAVKRLSQEAAMEEAATSEEVANAPRLREVVRHKKTQEVYEEQGYEDAGYDHGGSKKLKFEEEVKDDQSVEVLGPNNSSSQSTEETKGNSASIAPFGRGSWSRHRTTTGKNTKYEVDGDKRKVTTNDSIPISEKTSGHYTKFDGGKIIIVQNVTETEKKDSKKEGAESRRVASFSKTRDNIEPTTYRPTIRHNSSRNANKQIKNEPKRNRTRSRPRKRLENNVQKLQTDVTGSYDNSPWIPISPLTDNHTSQHQNKKHIKSKMNSELHEPNGHASKYGYAVNHDTPYKYVFPTDLLAPESSSKPNRKLRPKSENTGVTDERPKVSPFVNYGFIPQTNYDGSAINPKQKITIKSLGDDLSFDNIRLPLSDKYKESISQFTTHFTHNAKVDGSAIIQRQKNNPIQAGSSEYFKSNLKPEPYREQKKNGPRNVETELGNYGNSGLWYTSTVSQDFGFPETYNAPFITRRKKNKVNVDLRGDPSLGVYPNYEYYPHFQNVKYSVKDEKHHGHIPLSNINNKGQANIEYHESLPRSNNQESARLFDHPKFNIRPQHIHTQSSESTKNVHNFPKVTDQTSQEKYFRFNKADDYPKFELNKRFEIQENKSPSVYKMIPYGKTVKTNNPYSYVNHDDHYPSGSRYSGVKVETTTQSQQFDNKFTHWNSRHPHLPKDSIRNTADEHKSKSQEENTRHVENLTLAHFSGHHKSGFYRPLPLEYNERVNNLAKLLNDNYPKRTRRDLEVINIASSGTTTEIPIDTVVYSHYKRAPKQSALRYATNPNLAPRKTAGGMEFYASTDGVKCNGIQAPTGIVPERTEDGEWKGELANKSPRVEDLGDQIGCFKIKFFGSDPLDNPIFKEKDVGFPDILFTVKKQPEKKNTGIDPGKSHVNWDFTEKLIPDQWFPNDKRNRRSDNNSLPINHKIQGMASIIPEPVILTFPTKSTTVVYTNDTNIDKKNVDSDVSSNREHVFQYSVLHPTTKLESNVRKDHSTDSKIVGLIPPPQSNKKIKKQQKVKKSTVNKIFKKIKVNDESNESDFLDVLSPITSLFADEDDSMVAPIVHNFFNIKMTPFVKLKATTTVDENNDERINKFQIQNYRRTKRNMKGVELQRPKQRKLNIDTNKITNVSLSLPTARVRMYTPKNGTWFRDKREHVLVNVDIRRNEPRYYYNTERQRVRVKRVVHNPPFYNKSGQVFSSKYLISDQDNSETLPEEVNVAFSTTPKPIYRTAQTFIPAIAFGDSKAKIINYNDTIANSTNNNEYIQFDKKGSLIYVINPDTGLGKWMKVIKVKNEEDTKPAFTNGSVYLETRPKNVSFSGSIGKFGFKGPRNDLFKNALGSTMDRLNHRFKLKLPSNEPMKSETAEKAKCPKYIRLRKKEKKRRTTTSTTTSTTEIPEIPVIEVDLDDRPQDQSEEEEEEEEEETTPSPRAEEEEETTTPHREEEEITPLPREDEEEEEGGEVEGGGRGGGEDENEEEQPVERLVKRPRYRQESEETSDNRGNDQEVYESERKTPYSLAKKPKFNRHRFRPRDKNNIYT